MCNEQGIYGYHVQTIHKETGEVVNSWFSKEWEGPLQAAPHSIKGFETIATPVYLAPPTYTAIAAMVIKQAAEALEPFALISSEGVIQQESGHVTVTTCAEYFHRARQLLEKLTPAAAEAELEALMMKVAEMAWKDGCEFGKGEDSGETPETIVRRVLDEMKGEVMSNARTCNKCGGMTKFQLNDNGYPCFCESDTIQVSRVEYEALQAELAEAIRQRDKLYGEANLERENAATYRTVLEMCVAATTEEIPFGDLPGMVEALQKAAGQLQGVGAGPDSFTDDVLRQAILHRSLQMTNILDTVEPVAWRWKPSDDFPDLVVSDDKEKTKAALSCGLNVQPLYTLPPTASQALRMAADYFRSLITDRQNPYDNALHYCAEALDKFIPPTEYDQRKLGFAEEAANLVTVDRRDLHDFVRAAIKDALSTEDEFMHDESWLWAESDFRTCKCLNKLAIKEQK